MILGMQVGFRSYYPDILHFLESLAPDQYNGSVSRHHYWPSGWSGRSETSLNWLFRKLVTLPAVFGHEHGMALQTPAQIYIMYNMAKEHGRNQLIRGLGMVKTVSKDYPGWDLQEAVWGRIWSQSGGQTYRGGTWVTWRWKWGNRYAK